MRWKTLLLLSLLSLFAWAKPGWKIEGGKGFGPVALGQLKGEVDQVLGKPNEVKSGSDGLSQLCTYVGPLLVLFNGEGQAIGITVLEKGVTSAHGIGIGSSLAEERKQLGPGLQQGPGQYAFPDQGLALALNSQERVDRIFVVKKDAKLALAGDRLVIAGSRAGDIKLGQTLSSVEKAWGAAGTQKDKDFRWPDKGIGLLVKHEKIIAITLTTGDYITPEGIKVGTLKAEVENVLGKAPLANGTNWFYPKRGLAIYFAGDQVSTLQVFAPQP